MKPSKMRAEVKCRECGEGEFSVAFPFHRKCYEKYKRQLQNPKSNLKKIDCKRCGEPTHNQKYCSNRCRIESGIKYGEEYRKKNYIEYNCNWCDTTFMAWKSQNRKYCSSDCHIRAQVKFDGKQAKKVRELYATGEYTMKKLAAKFSCSYITIWNVINEKRAYSNP